MITLCNIPFQENSVKEKLTFIVDHPKLNSEEKYEYAKTFAKSCGFKSDSVGWVSDIVPTPQILQKIFHKAKNDGVNIRAYYDIDFSEDHQSLWYFMRGNPTGGYLAASDWDKYDDYPIGTVKAYSVPENIRFTRVGCTDFLMLREDVVKEIEKAGFKGLEFVWCPDKGRYRSLQYFQSFPDHVLPYWYQCTRRRLTEDIASVLTENAKILASEAKEVWIELPMAIDTDMVSHYDFVATYPADNHDNRILVRKCVRDHLIEKKLARHNDFEPIIVADALTMNNAFPLKKRVAGNYVPPPQSVKAVIADEYRKSLKKEKPIHFITEKAAVSKLRTAKKENRQFFGKKASEKSLENAIDERLKPYYKVADGGALSDEYSYYSISDATDANEEFWGYQSEEDTDIIPAGAKVFGVCADGEYIILFQEGSVVRYQQGEVQIGLKWTDLPSFFADTIQEQ